jgi:(R,R)-butanediol dehydrogenase / meso-butanediol dehydrogenase / diacetyl reductase
MGKLDACPNIHRKEGINMKAAVWYGKKDIRIEDREVAYLGENDVKINVAWAGICGSDLHEYAHGPIQIPVDNKDPLTGNQAPLTMGHEFAGIIEEIGESVTKFKIGDRVTVNPGVTYGVRDDSVDIYDGYAAIGLHTDGGFAETVVVNQKHVYILPNSLTLEDGALVEPMAVGVQAIKEANFRMGQTAAIVGAGPIGLLTIVAAKAAGASKIIVMDLSEARLEKAKEVGATHIINSGKVDPVEEVKKIEPNGVDATFEVAGIEPTFKQAVRMTKARGIVTVISIFAKPISFNPMSLTTSGVKITSTFAYEPITFQQTIDMMANGQLKPQGIVTDRIELQDIVEAGFEVLSNDKAQAKILVGISKEK